MANQKIIRPTESQIRIYSRGKAIPLQLNAGMFKDNEKVSIDISRFQRYV